MFIFGSRHVGHWGSPTPKKRHGETFLKLWFSRLCSATARTLSPDSAFYVGAQANAFCRYIWIECNSEVLLRKGIEAGLEVLHELSWTLCLEQLSAVPAWLGYFPWQQHWSRAWMPFSTYAWLSCKAFKSGFGPFSKAKSFLRKSSHSSWLYHFGPFARKVELAELQGLQAKLLQSHSLAVRQVIGPLSFRSRSFLWKSHSRAAGSAAGVCLDQLILSRQFLLKVVFLFIPTRLNGKLKEWIKTLFSAAASHIWSKIVRFPNPLAFGSFSSQTGTLSS